jgi:hypothetical protein
VAKGKRGEGAPYPQWVAALSGKLGPSTRQGFILVEAELQVFEKKPKEAKGPTAPEPPVTGMVDTPCDGTGAAAVTDL